MGTGILGSVSVPVFHNGGLFCGAWDVEDGGGKTRVEAGLFFFRKLQKSPPSSCVLKLPIRFREGCAD